MAAELGQTDIEAGGRKLWQLFKLLSLGHGITSTLYGCKNTVKKIDHGLEHVRTNLRFFGLSLSFYSSY